VKHRIFHKMALYQGYDGVKLMLTYLVEVELIKMVLP
jgi:hypothetical protein